ncbi:MAG TPA: ABC transporter permease [Pirellulales bacterium]|jgi:ABC-2 type transport system permease protein|nr:ABC transporter permease [Pirellulales bacterium]
MWQRIRTLVVKELLAVWSDPRSRVVLIVPPVIQMLIFSFAATQEIKNVRLAVLNRDWGTASRDLIARFEGSPYFREVRFLTAESQIAEAIDSRSVLMVLHIQSDFSRQVASGGPAAVQLLLDGRRSNGAQLVAGYASAIIEAYNEELALVARGNRPPSAVVSRIWFNPNHEGTWHSVPGLVAILTTVMGLVVTALSVARERELGTFEQLLVSPLSPAEIIVGKTLPALLIGVGEASGMVLVGVFVFRVPFHGSIALLYLSMLVYLLAVIGAGLFISSLVKTQQQAILGAFVFMQPAVLLSGFASPIENMPDWMQWITLANPIRYFLVIVKGLFLKDIPISIVLQNLWPMVIIAVATLSAATWLFRKRME